MRGNRLHDAAHPPPSAATGPVGDGISVVIAPPGAPAPEGAQWQPARAALASLGPSQQVAALRAIAVANWRQRGRFCPGCGGGVEVDAAGTGWRCLTEDRPVFPRTDPCVITAVLDGAGRLLLSHASNHPEGLHTLVAGFVEAGESLEDAVRRETLEEVGLPIGPMRFIRSQPWPFPGSLMASFVARATASDIKVDGVEITAARWFSRPDLDQALASGQISLPMPYSVARQTIEAWRADTLPTP
jgi:NAD+ diphosphatase